VKICKLSGVIVSFILISIIFSASNLHAITFTKKIPDASSSKDLKDYNLVEERQEALAWIDSLRKNYSDSAGWVVVNETSNRGYVYDNALAIIAYTIAGDYSAAEEILDFLKMAQTSEGSFYDSILYSNPWSADAAMHSGNQAWVLYAINFYMYKTGNLGVNNSYLTMAEDVAEWLMARQDPSDGGIVGGKYITWTSTEHNIDAYFAFKLLYNLPRRFSNLSFNEDYSNAMEGCKNWLLNVGWNSSQLRFNRGENDPYKSLDPQTWGSLFLNDIGDYTKQNQAVDYVHDTFSVSTTRYGYNTQTYNGFKENEYGNHWLEGTMQMSVALLRSGDLDEARFYVDEVIRSDDPAYASGHPNDDNDGDGGKQYFMVGTTDEQPGTVLWEIFAINEILGDQEVIFFPIEDEGEEQFSPYDLNCDGSIKYILAISIGF